MTHARLLSIALMIAVVIGGATVAGASAVVSAAPRIVPQNYTVVSTEDGDLFAEAGERFGLAVEIRNVGDAPATGITATLAPTTVQYPDLAPGAAATNATPFEIAMPSTFSCGDGYRRVMTVNTQQGAFVMSPVAPVSSVGRPESWTSMTPLDIPDLATVESPLTLGAGPMATILDLNVRINDLSHTWVGDLAISLVSPSGGTITLADRRGAGANFTNTVFDDEASTAIADGSPPFTGAFRSDSVRLYQRDGDDATGTWKLRVRDNELTDTGRLNSWSIDALTARCNEQPTASLAIAPLPAIVGKPVTFTASAADRDGQIASQAWDLDNDGEFDDATGPTAKRTFSTPGRPTLRFRAIDDLGNAKILRTTVGIVRVCRVPRVVGRRLPAAVRAIKRAGCRVGRVRRARSRRAGRVLRQSPRPGVQRRYGTRVNLVVGRR
jgi:subtilisin-like proprotein convertase family protein